MTTCTVGFKVSDGLYSVNMIWSNTGECEMESITETAERRAKKFGYEVAYINRVSNADAECNIHKGMPIYMIDKDIEEKYDPSFRT